MIEFQTKEDIVKMLAWFRSHLLLPKAILLSVEYNTGGDDPAFNIIRVNFGSTFYVTFVGVVIEIEDLCRAHTDEYSAKAVRGVIAAFLRDPETCVFKDGTLWDELDRDLREQVYAFSTFFS